MSKESRSEYNRRYRIEHAEELAAKRKARREADPEKSREAFRKWHSKNREEHNRKQREKYHADPEAAREYAKAWRAANKDQIRDSLIRKKYGMTREGFNERLQSQGGKCAICQRTDPGKKGWYVDHDHACCSGVVTCGQCVRGLLCVDCNTMLGRLNDNVEILQKAIDYLNGVVV